MNRWLALAIAIVGGGVVGFFVWLGLMGAILGIAWLYVFGDDPWPGWSDYVLGGIIIIGAALIWAFCGRMIWLELRKRF